MKTLQDRNILLYLEEWFRERTTFCVKNKINTEKVYADYLYFTEEIKKKQVVRRKTFITQLKLYLREDIISPRVVHTYKTISSFKGLQLLANDNISSQN